MADIQTLQIGLEWMPERAGGLPRYYYDLWRHSKPAFDFRGLVIGTEGVAKESGGEVLPIASASSSVPARMLSSRRAVSKALADWQPDLVTTHFALTTRAAVDLIDRPFVLHFHGPWAGESSSSSQKGLRYRFKYMIEADVYRRTDQAIVLSSAFRDVLRDVYGYDESRIHIVPGGVDVARFNISENKTEAREHLGWPTDRPVVVAVRRLVRRMGLEGLIDAIGKIRERHPDVLAYIGGKGQLANELQARIEERGLQDHVKLLGFVADEDLPLVYRAADVSIVPTQALEGFGLIALESLAASTPVLVSPVGGLPEVVNDLSPDLVFADTESDTIAERLEAALYRGARPDDATCLEYARGFDWPVIADRLAGVYRGVLS